MVDSVEITVLVGINISVEILPAPLYQQSAVSTASMFLIPYLARIKTLFNSCSEEYFL